MSSTKETFDKIVENQHKLAETLSSHAQKATEMFEADHSAIEFSKETYQTMVAKAKEQMEAMKQPESPEEAWKTMSAAFSQMIDMQTEMYNKTTEFYRNWFEKYNFKFSQEKFSQATEIYQESFKAIMDTASANTKAMQDFFQTAG